MPSDEILAIDTPEQMRLEYPLAGVGSRFLALLVDTLYQLLLVTALLVAMLIFAPVLRAALPDSSAWILAIVTLALFLVQFGYFAIFEASWNGQTPGKRQFGLRVIKATGRPITPSESVARNLLRIVDGLPGMYGIGILAVMITSRRQRLGDLVAGTVVVHELPVALEPLSWQTPAPASGPAPANAARLTDEELVVAESFLQRRWEISEANRAMLASQLAERFGARFGVAREERPDDEKWIESLVQAARERANRS